MADIEGQRRKRLALERSEERFRLLVDSVVDYAIFLLDTEGRVASWNPGAQRLKGYHADDIIGVHYSAFYTDEDRGAGLPEQLLAEAVQQGRTEVSGWRVRQDGSSFWADVVITALFDGEEHTGFAKVTRDMTEAHLTSEARERALEEQRRALSRLEDLDRWRREFIDAVAHDLQTPVTAIEGFARMLEAGAGGDERARMLDHVRSNTRALQELIDNLRAFTLLSAGQVTLDPEPIELRPFVEGLVASMAPLFGERDVRVEVADLRVIADRNGLERVLRNLLANAARHTDASVPVGVHAASDDGGVRIEVHDRGGGIPPTFLPRIFDRFESVGKGGTGLGLAIARHYVELHGGTITVDSVEGQGATFAVILPGPDRR